MSAIRLTLFLVALPLAVLALAAAFLGGSGGGSMPLVPAEEAEAAANGHARSLLQDGPNGPDAMPGLRLAPGRAGDAAEVIASSAGTAADDRSGIARAGDAPAAEGPGASADREATGDSDETSESSRPVQRGQVRSSDNRVLEGLKVSVRRRSPVIDGRGSPVPPMRGGGWVSIAVNPDNTFAFKAPPGPEYEILVEAKAHAPELAIRPARLPGARPVEVVLQRRGAIRGTVLDAQTEAPVVGARVRIDQGMGITQTAITDASGVYRLSGVRPTFSEVSVSHPGYEPQRAAYQPTQISGGVQSIDFRVRRGFRAVVRLDVPEGMPLVDELELQLNDEYRRLMVGVHTFAPGDIKTHEFQGVAADTLYRASVYAGSRLLGTQLFSTDASGIASDVVVRLGSPWMLQGRVQTTEGTPLSDVALRLLAEGTVEGAPVLIDVVRPDARGDYRIPNLSSAISYRLEATHAPSGNDPITYASQCVSRLTVAYEEPSLTTDFFMAAAATAVGRLLNAEGEALQRRVVELRMLNADGWCGDLVLYANTDAVGAFRFPGLPGGDFVVTLLAPDYQLEGVSRSITAGQRIDLGDLVSRPY